MKFSNKDSDEINLGCHESRFDFEGSKANCDLAEKEPPEEFTKYDCTVVKSNL
jgi:hypothetical protein